MPGPKMGPRPVDFDEEIIKQSPTFQKWLELQEGERLKYACREFIKGHRDDEERLMRRIMIARRNNIRDHETLKKARRMQKRPCPPAERRKAAAMVLQDHVVEREMDVAAVEGTRSYKKWMELPEGAEFVYNQRYVKGKEGHDWLLKKNIWRRMRYRRENKKMVEKLRTVDPPEPQSHGQALYHHHPPGAFVDGLHHHRQPQHVQHQQQQLLHHHHPGAATAATIGHPGALLGDHGDFATSVDAAASTTTAEEAAAAAAAAAAADHFADQAAIEAAVAAAEHFGKATADEEGSTDPLMVHDPLQAAAAQAALDAAARLAHISHPGNGLSEHHHQAGDQQQHHRHHHQQDVETVDDTERFLLDDEADGVGDIIV